MGLGSGLAGAERAVAEAPGGRDRWKVTPAVTHAVAAVAAVAVASAAVPVAVAVAVAATSRVASKIGEDLG